jgi:CBS domain-containing protein
MRAAPGLLAPDTSLEDAERMMARLRVPALIVERRGRVLGVVTAVDLAAARPSPATSLAIGEVRGWLAQLRVEDVMRRDPPVVAPVTPFVDTARLLRESATGMVPVVADELLIGVVTIFDALEALSRRNVLVTNCRRSRC